MKTIAPILTVLAFLMPFAAAQEGNSILDNREAEAAKALWNTIKDEPDRSLNNLKSNPDAAVRSATAVFADKTKKYTNGGTNKTAVPATRSSRTQTEKALSNFRGIVSKPVPAQARPVSETVREQIDSIDPTAIDKAKRLADEMIPTISDRLQPNDPVSRVKTMTSTPEVSIPRVTNNTVPEPAPRINRENRTGSPLPAVGSQRPVIPSRGSDPIPSVIPEFDELFAGPTPAPRALAPRYPKPSKFQPSKNLPSNNSNPSKPKPDENTMVITASETVMDRPKQKLTFRGDVILEMQDMEMKCENLIVDLDSNNQMKMVTATGGLVQVKRIVFENGKPVTQVAKARKAVHVAATKVTTLSGGPPYLQNGDQYINTSSEDSVIELDGITQKYRVGGPKAETKNPNQRSVIVVPIGNAKQFSGDLGLENKMKIRR